MGDDGASDLDVVVCTIIAGNYLAQARCLAESFRAQHPDGRMFVLLCDRDDGSIVSEHELFTLVTVDELAIADFAQMAFRYDVVELCTALKPFFLEYLFVRYGLQRLIYLDPDIYCYQPLTPVLTALEQADVVLTPHLLEPLESTAPPTEQDILRAGIYNLGFIGLARSPGLIPLLRWWQRRLRKDCVRDVARGLFVDQRWADLIPAFCERTRLLRDPTCNAAYWNLAQRRIRHDGTRWLANGAPLTFYHFSGLRLEQIDQLSTHQSGFSLQEAPDLRPLLEHYRDRLLGHGYITVQARPYGFGTFDNGVPIPEMARRLWRELDGETRWPRPFQSGPSNSFFHWLSQSVRGGRADRPLLSNLALEIYRQRIDLHSHWPDPHGAHRQAYLEWFVSDGAAQHRLDAAFVEPVHASLSRSVERSASLPHHRLQPLPAVPLSGPDTFGRRCYYAIRNPLRSLGLHRLVRRLLGERMTDAIHNRLVQPHSGVALSRLVRRAPPPPSQWFDEGD